jgi:hypothetical protein
MPMSQGDFLRNPAVLRAFLAGQLGRLGPGASDNPSADAFQGNEDRVWALEHPQGYGQVDAPSPWGYNRQGFDTEHPGYAGGYYDPASGFYDSPRETPFAASGPYGPETIGTGQPATPWEAPSYSSGPAMGGDPMAGLPTGGDSGAGSWDWSGQQQESAPQEDQQPQNQADQFQQFLDMMSAGWG